MSNEKRLLGLFYSLAIFMSAGFVNGCGSNIFYGEENATYSNDTHQDNNTSNENNNTNNTVKNVKVVDGYVIGANVCDQKGVCATTDLNGTAVSIFDGQSILTAKGGYIDVNNNKKIDDEDIMLPETFTLKTPNGKNIITPLTDLVANGVNATKLADFIGVNTDSLFSDPVSTNNIKIAKAIQIAYIVKAEHKESEFVKKISEQQLNESNKGVDFFADVAIEAVSGENADEQNKSVTMAISVINNIKNMEPDNVLDLEKEIAFQKKELIKDDNNEKNDYSEYSENNQTQTDVNQTQIDDDINGTNLSDNNETVLNNGDSNETQMDVNETFLNSDANTNQTQTEINETNDSNTNIDINQTQTETNETVLNNDSNETQTDMDVNETN